MMFARGGAVAEAMDSAAGADDFAADAAPSADSGAAAETSSSSDGEEFSGTNVQEEGVDEADTVKATADGFIYVAGTVRGGERRSDGSYSDCGYRLSVVRDDPGGGVELVASVDLEPLATTPKAMFVDGDVLLLYGSADLVYESEEETDDRPYWCRDSSQTATVALAFDVSDPTAPTLVRRHVFEGRYVSARKIDTFAYLVVARSSWYVTPRASVPFYRDETFEDGFAVDDGASYAEAAAAAGPAAPICGCGDVTYVSAASTNLDDVTVIVALDVSDATAARTAPATVETIAMRAGDSAVYASRTHLYLAQTEWSGYDGGSYYRTVVLKLRLDGADVTYETIMAAPGRLLNQFALSQGPGGELRVATTSREPDGAWRDTSNDVYVFDATGERVGAVTGLAPGEEIMSARFTATRCYLVTFVQTDPLFVIALDDPTQPEVLGELKIPGFSSYLHPVNDTHVLGVGRDAVAEGNGAVVLGIQFSLFDVSDELNPRRVAALTVGDRGSESEALDEHKAFQLWSREALRAAGVLRTAGVFAVPASLASLSLARARQPDNDYLATSPWASGETWFQGLLVYDVALAAVGNVTHLPEGFYAGNDDGDDGWYGTASSQYSGAHVTRSLRRGADLFSFSDNHVFKTSLDGRTVAGTANLAANASFEAGDDDDGYGYGYGYFVAK
mmetsp:Transcript_27053/g.84108  ORF Transcript_27053/g.84108 Transcript_27053/m.84108 type:complete len:676 (-) Transcript_27053:87-2114(-)